jgi:hypothetical protein
VCVTVMCCYSTVQHSTALCVCYCNVLLQYSVSTKFLFTEKKYNISVRSEVSVNV